jgi:ABC-type branched-subunit amino acid transport system substrate-binding protein
MMLCTYLTVRGLRPEEDVAVVRPVREAGVEVGLLGSVAAGIDEFGRRLGRLADGVLGPAQWWCRHHPVDVGPSGPEFVRRFEERLGHAPDYLAAQAAAAGYLAAEAAARGLRCRPSPGVASRHLAGSNFAWTAPGGRSAMSRLPSNGAEAGECSPPSRGPECRRSSAG